MISLNNFPLKEKLFCKWFGAGDWLTAMELFLAVQHLDMEGFCCTRESSVAVCSQVDSKAVCRLVLVVVLE